MDEQISQNQNTKRHDKQQCHADCRVPSIKCDKGPRTYYNLYEKQ